MTLHCKLRAGPGGRNESAGCGSLTHCGSERSPRPAPRPGWAVLRNRGTHGPELQNPLSKRNCRLRLWEVGAGQGRAGRGFPGRIPH